MWVGQVMSGECSQALYLHYMYMSPKSNYLVRFNYLQLTPLIGEFIQYNPIKLNCSSNDSIMGKYQNHLRNTSRMSFSLLIRNLDLEVVANAIRCKNIGMEKVKLSLLTDIICKYFENPSRINEKLPQAI